MSDEVQAKIERLRQLLGDEFPEPVVERRQSRDESNEMDEFEKANPYDPTIKLIKDGSETDSDPDTVHRPAPRQSSGRSKKPKRQQNDSGTTWQQDRSFPTNSDFVHFNPHNESVGRLAPPHQSFCPIVAISKYPYKFLPNDIAEHVAKKFFDGGKFWLRPWDVWYVWPPIDLSASPLYLVPVEQVEQLLDDIYFGFDKDERYFLTLGDEAKDFGLVLDFPAHPDLRPRQMGLSQSRDAFTSMTNHTPSDWFRPKDEPQPKHTPDPAEIERWRRILQDGMEIIKGRNAISKANKKEKQKQKKQAWLNELHRAERMLGFRPRRQTLEEPGSHATWDELQAYHAAKSSHRKLSPINSDEPSPFDFDTLPIFISVDVECNEKQKSQVTEIGLAMLDTSEILHLAPGPNGTNWHSAIKARHFRTLEFAHIRNTHFMGPMGAAAENFMYPENGSEMIMLAQVPDMIASCFAPPYCDIDRTRPASIREEDTVCQRNGSNNGMNVDVNDSCGTVGNEGGVLQDLHSGMIATGADMSDLRIAETPSSLPHDAVNGLEASSTSSTQITASNRNNDRTIILVGHDIQQDIRYLHSLGLDLEDLGSTSTIDTANLCRAHMRDMNPRSLSHLLDVHDLIGRHHHNAGNDAVHSLWVMVALVMAHCQERGSERAKERHEERQKQRLEEAIVAAGTTAMEEGEGWESDKSF